MNLVMSDITRNKLGCYMAQQASLNNIPVSALVSRFTVEPSVQQRFENASKESTEFTKRINVIGVTDQKGEKILLDTTGPIARTNTSYDGTKRRNPNNVVDLKNRKYQCEQVNYDTFIRHEALAHAWRRFPSDCRMGNIHASVVVAGPGERQKRSAGQHPEKYRRHPEYHQRRGTGYAAGAGATPRGKSATQSGRRGKT